MIVTIGILYFLGAYLMWMIGDEKNPEDMRKRPLYSAFWPLVVIAGIIEGFFMRDDE